VPEGQLDVVRRLGLDPEHRAAPHRKRLPRVAVRDPVDDLERRLALDRLDDAAADLRVAIRIRFVDDRERDARIARDVARLP
jgi:hypothetical protein